LLYLVDIVVIIRYRLLSHDVTVGLCRRSALSRVVIIRRHRISSLTVVNVRGRSRMYQLF